MNKEVNENKVILDESSFMRGKLFNSKSNLQKYSNLTIGDNPSFPKLIKYELITSFFGLIPGALGLLLRKMLYPKLFHSSGRGVNFGRNITVRCGQNIILGNNVVIDDNCVLDARGAEKEKIILGNNVVLNRDCIVQSKVGGIEIGDYSTVGTKSIISSQGGIRIGKWVGLAGGSKVSGGLFESKQQENPDATPFIRYTRGPIQIGDNTIIASGAIILDGVKVGKDCMIGPGCIVTTDLQDSSVLSARPGIVLKR